MNINKEVKYIIDLFDNAFERLGQKPLSVNPDFQVDEMNCDHWQKYTSVEKLGRLKIALIISSDGLSFWLDRTQEIPEWSFEYINKNKEEVEMEISRLFESNIEVEYKGNKTTIRLLNSNGFSIRQFRYYYGLRINWFSKKSTKLFKPFFEI